MPEKKKVLFVCTGNTCRSPMAEGLFRQIIQDDDSVQCLGSAGVSAYPGDRMSRDTAVILKSKGADQSALDGFRSRPVDDQMLSEATHVYAMTEAHLEMLIGEFPDFADKCYLVCDFVSFNGKVGVDVPDPIGQGPRAYQMVAQVFDNALPTLMQFMNEQD